MDINASFIELTYYACLNAFWRKKALHRFLMLQGIPKSLLQNVLIDTKADTLDTVFAKLSETVKGKKIIFNMAKALIEMEDFPDLDNWEDSSKMKLKAKNSVSCLKNEFEKITRKKEEKSEVQKKRQASKVKIENTIGRKKQLEKLMDDLKEIATRMGTQKAGYDFEDWFYELSKFFEMKTKPPYKAQGRQIDGSITIEGMTYLIETKLQTNPIGSEDIDIFMGKIERKAHYTMGIMVSMSGYNSGAIKTASKEQTPMLLMDSSHIFNLIEPDIMSLPEIISRIKRNASQTGDSYLSVDKFSG